ncbi:hypothetical protein HDE78_002606 [Rhodanobacter sp. K2T2]|nr:hypothetical protein [Rhodanobacter sp. K2T2]
MNCVPYLVFALLLLFGSSVMSAEDAWLQPAPINFWGKDWRKIPAANYLDLGDDPVAVNMLKDAKFIVDTSTSGRSLSLNCKLPSKRYLVRSLFLGNMNNGVYQSSNGLIITAASFSEPREPSNGAIATCLTGDPVDVRGNTSFDK